MKRPILYVLIPFAFGIALSSIIKTPTLHTFILSLLLFVFSILSSNKKSSHLALYAAIFLFGAFFYQSSVILPGDHIARFASDEAGSASIRGTISDDPTVSVTPYNKTRTSFVLNVDAVKIGDSWRTARGLVDTSIYSQAPGHLRFGQEIIAEGSLSKPSGLKNPGSFDYPKYLSLKDIYAVFRVKDESAVKILSETIRNPVKALAYRIRNRMGLEIDKYLKEPYSGFIKAIMIGDRTGLKYSVNDDFVKTGTVHAIAISGLNVGLIAAIFLALFALARMPKKLNLVIVAGILVLYAFIAGSSPPIVRAVIIFIVFVAGYLINRESDMLNSLAFTAFLMLLVNPKELFDPSFQLSFASIAGMIIFTPPINRLLRIDTIDRASYLGRTRFYIFSAVSVSIAATAATWPIVASYFNIISPVALFANLLVVPALFLLTAASFLLIFTGLFFGTIAAMVGIGLDITCKTLFAANHILANMPWAYFRVPAPTKIFTTVYYISLIALTFTINNIRSSSGDKTGLAVNGRKAIRILIATALILNLLVWREALMMNRDSIKITFIDVGQGDSALIELPGGRNMLIDSGPGGDEDKFDAARSAIAPYLWNRGITRIDHLVITHFHEDHLGGALYLIDNFKIGQVMDTGAAVTGSAIFDKYLRILKVKNVRRERIGEGDVIEFSGGKIFVLNPEKGVALEDSNENSIVMKLQYKKIGVLFCADASGRALERMTDSYGKFLWSDVIKIPHHGGNVGDENIVKNFFSTVGAKTAIISVAKTNKYRAPSHKTLSLIRHSTPITYETKNSGAITISIFDSGLYSIRTHIKAN